MKQALQTIIRDKERKSLNGEATASASFNRIILKFPAIRVSTWHCDAAYDSPDYEKVETLSCVLDSVHRPCRLGLHSSPF